MLIRMLSICSLVTLGLGNVAIFNEPLEPVDTRFIGYQQEKAYERYLIMEIISKNNAQLKKVSKIEETVGIWIDYWNMANSLNDSTKVMIKKNDYRKLTIYLDKNNIEYILKENKLEDLIRNENLKNSNNAFNMFSGFDYSRYHHNDEIVREMYSLSNQYSQISSIINLGSTYEGRKMPAIKISVSNDPNRKMFFMMCGLHAREWVTTASCIYMINKMLSGYYSDPTITLMLKKMDWVILPVANVDGYVYSWKNSNTRLWRKTRKPYNHGRCFGADPNRNFNHMWGVIGASDNPCSNTFKGSKAFSEDCVANIGRYLYDNKHILAGFTDVHAYSQLWMTPWGYTRTRPDHYTEQMRVARAAVQALYKKYGTYFKYGSSSVIIYPTSGASDDWVYGSLGVKYSFGLELRDKGQYGFMLPAEQIVPTAEETFAGFMAMAAEMRI